MMVLFLNGLLGNPIATEFQWAIIIVIHTVCINLAIANKNNKLIDILLWHSLKLHHN